MNSAAQILKPFVEHWADLLTTYRRDGNPVGTAVNVVVEGRQAEGTDDKGSRQDSGRTRHAHRVDGNRRTRNWDRLKLIS